MRAGAGWTVEMSKMLTSVREVVTRAGRLLNKMKNSQRVSAPINTIVSAAIAAFATIAAIH